MSQGRRGKPKKLNGLKKERVFYYIAPSVSGPFDECCRTQIKTPSVVLEELMRIYVKNNSSPERLREYLKVLDREIAELSGPIIDLYELKELIKEKLGVTDEK